MANITTEQGAQQKKKSQQNNQPTQLADSGTPQAGVPWSIFEQGGGSGAALTWAEDALREIGAPLNTTNEQVIYDWEESEGGGGWYNPLNQGDDPNDPSLTSTGSQYGGGAANYVSYAAGFQGFKDYLNMDQFSDIKQDLTQSAPYTDTVTDIVNSPWAASHYGYGANWNTSPIPSHASALKGSAGIGDSIETTSFISGINSLSNLTGDLTSADFWERIGLVIFGIILVIIGIIVLVMPAGQSALAQTAKAARQVNTIKGGFGGSGGSGGPSPEERADRDRRLALAEKNTEIGSLKASTAAKREARLSSKRHNGKEPNPQPAHN